MKRAPNPKKMEQALNPNVVKKMRVDITTWKGKLE